MLKGNYENRPFFIRNQSFRILQLDRQLRQHQMILNSRSNFQKNQSRIQNNFGLLILNIKLYDIFIIEKQSPTTDLIGPEFWS